MLDFERISVDRDFILLSLTHIPLTLTTNSLNEKPIFVTTLGFCNIWLSTSLELSSAHATQYSSYQYSDVP